MTESEWLSSTDPRAMLKALRPGQGELGLVLFPGRVGGEVAYRVSDRKLRLFALACQDAFMPIRAESYRRVRETDGAEDDFSMHVEMLAFLWADTRIVSGNPLLPIRNREEDQPHKAAILHDIVGNPFRPMKLPHFCGEPLQWSESYSRWRCPKCRVYPGMPGCSSWLTWNDGTVPKLAQSIYDQRHWDLMPILADALEEVGCDNEDILRHCRGQELCVGRSLPGSEQSGWCSVCDQHTDDVCWIPLRGPHVRGCWVLDLIRGV